MERRRLLATGLALPAALLLARTAGGRQLVATPACGKPTERSTAGPFYKPQSPERSSLREPGLAGMPMVLAGRVLTADCRPAAGALVDLWHADGEGRYDNEGYRCRGHQFADDDGGFRFETVRPGLYPGRTRHFHVRVQAPGGPLLTTQLYFPDEPGNAGDFIFRPALVMAVEGAEAGFDFVVAG